MALTQYCELDEVRAALGVNNVELPDTVLNLPVYEIGLVRELAKVSSSLPAAFLAIQNTAESTWTTAQRAVYDATHMFSVYACAKQVGVSLGAMVPKDVGDGKATLSRFADAPYKDVLDRVEQMLKTCRTDLATHYATLLGSTTPTSTVVPMTVFKASGRVYDPITG
jgi:hypothetical protein